MVSSRTSVSLCLLALFFLLLLLASPSPKPLEPQPEPIPPSQALTSSNSTETESNLPLSENMANIIYNRTFDFLDSAKNYSTPYLTASGYISDWVAVNPNVHYFACDGSSIKVWCETGNTFPTGSSGLRRGSGTKCLGQQSTGRNELNILPQQIQSNIQKIYVETWLYLEPTYELTESNYWHEIANPIQSDESQGRPKMKIHFYKHTGTGLYDIKMMYQQNTSPQFTYLDSQSNLHNITLENMPRNRWFQFKWFVDRSNNICKAWIVDEGTEWPICDTSDYDLGYSTYPNDWYTSISKIYYGAGSQSFNQTMKIWCDGFTIYDDMPTIASDTETSANLKVIRENTVDFNAALKVIHENLVDPVSMNVRVVPNAPTCVWGDPTDEQREAFYRAGDVNRDDVIDNADLTLISDHFTERGEPGWIPEDLNNDGMVDVDDLIIVGHNLGKSICDLDTDMLGFSVGLKVVEADAVVPFSANLKVIRENNLEFNMGVSVEAAFTPTLSPVWDKIVRAVGHIQTPNKITVGGLPEMRVGGPPVRVGVLTRHFEKIEKAVEKKKV